MWMLNQLLAILHLHTSAPAIVMRSVGARIGIRIARNQWSAINGSRFGYSLTASILGSKIAPLAEEHVEPERTHNRARRIDPVRLHRLHNRMNHYITSTVPQINPIPSQSTIQSNNPNSIDPIKFHQFPSDSFPPPPIQIGSIFPTLQTAPGGSTQNIQARARRRLATGAGLTDAPAARDI